MHFLWVDGITNKMVSFSNYRADKGINKSAASLLTENFLICFYFQEGLIRNTFFQDLTTLWVGEGTSMLNFRYLCL